MFKERLAKNIEEIKELYSVLYKDEGFDELLKSMKSYYNSRSKELKTLDLKRKENWFIKPDMIGMSMYCSNFSGDLQTLSKKIPYLKSLKIKYLHLMPLLKMPKVKNDGGYAVENFHKVDPRIGSNKDLKELSAKLRKSNISLCLDFIINHSASTHRWAKKALKGEKEYQDYYIMLSDKEEVDEYERYLQEVFPESAPKNFIYNKKINKWIFSTFYPYQWDLNYNNPALFKEMVINMFKLVNMGVQILRLDALPYIYKRKGTNCRNLEEVHILLRLIRLILEVVAPLVVLKGEVIMAPNQLAVYFGKDDKKEAHLLYNSSIMANIWSSLASDTRVLKKQLDKINTLGPDAYFINYLRCHDDIGWAIDEDDQRSYCIDPFLHKIYLYKFFIGQNSYARGQLYNYDKNTQDARSCGTTASLSGLESFSNEEEKEMALKRIFLMHSLIYFLNGIPMLNSADEIGSVNDYSYMDDKKRKDDSRNLHRFIFDWNKARLRKKEGSIENRIFNFLRDLAIKRKTQKTFNKGSIITTWDTHNDKVLMLIRMNKKERLIGLFNFSDREEYIYTEVLVGSFKDLFKDREITPGWGYTLKPYEFIWATSL